MRKVINDLLEIEKNQYKAMNNLLANEYDQLVKRFNTLTEEKEASFQFERNKSRFDHAALEQCIESLTAEMETINAEKRCILADRDSLRKHYKDFVMMARPDIMENQSGLCPKKGLIGRDHSTSVLNLYLNCIL